MSVLCYSAIQVRDFVTVDNLKEELDSLDLNSNSAEGDHQKISNNVNVAAVTDEKLVLEIKVFLSIQLLYI